MMVKGLMYCCLFHLVFTVILVTGVLDSQSLTMNCTSTTFHSVLDDDFWHVNCNLNRNLHQNETVVWSTSNCTELGQCNHIVDVCNITMNSTYGNIFLSASPNRFIMYMFINISIMENVIVSVFVPSKFCPVISKIVKMVENVDYKCPCPRGFSSTEPVSTMGVSTWISDFIGNNDYSTIEDERVAVTTEVLLSSENKGSGGFTGIRKTSRPLNPGNEDQDELGPAEGIFHSHLFTQVVFSALTVGSVVVIFYVIYNYLVQEGCKMDKLLRMFKTDRRADMMT